MDEGLKCDLGRFIGMENSADIRKSIHDSIAGWLKKSNDAESCGLAVMLDKWLAVGWKIEDLTLCQQTFHNDTGMTIRTWIQPKGMENLDK